MNYGNIVFLNSETYFAAAESDHQPRRCLTF